MTAGVSLSVLSLSLSLRQTLDGEEARERSPDRARRVRSNCLHRSVILAVHGIPPPPGVLRSIDGHSAPAFPQPRRSLPLLEFWFSQSFDSSGVHRFLLQSPPQPELAGLASSSLPRSSRTVEFPVPPRWFLLHWLSIFRVRFPEKNQSDRRPLLWQISAAGDRTNDWGTWLGPWATAWLPKLCSMHASLRAKAKPTVGALGTFLADFPWHRRPTRPCRVNGSRWLRRSSWVRASMRVEGSHLGGVNGERLLWFLAPSWPQIAPRCLPFLDASVSSGSYYYCFIDATYFSSHSLHALWTNNKEFFFINQI